jgi:hypothetical protein
MDILNKKIQDIVINNSKLINNNIIGINFLDRLKYLLIENNHLFEVLLFLDLKEKTEDSEIKNQFDFDNGSFLSRLNFYSKSVSKINNTLKIDTFFLIINGLNNIEIFDTINKEKSNFINLSPKMGIVLTENTVISQKIAKGTIILEIAAIKKPLNIEN